jgi:hypothetical protein
MNLKQKICLWIGIGLIVLMGFYPPWVLPVNALGIRGRQNHGYKLILIPPIHKSRDEELELGTSIDFQRLSVQWAAVALIIGGLIVTLKDNKKS